MTLRVSPHAANILTSLTFAGIGNAWIVKNCRLPMETAEFVEMLNVTHREDSPTTVERFVQRRDRIVADVTAQNSQTADGLTVFGEQNFPPIRGNVPPGHQPVVLYYKGNLELLDAHHNNVAVIGLLDPDTNSLDDERLIVSQLVGRGCVIISGLAHGCDTQAHRTALEHGGPTVAILPSTLSQIFPSDRQDLAHEIVARGGLLVTEYGNEPATSFEQTSRFIKRDRLQALFSDMVMLVASYSSLDKGRDSGSRHALDAARRYGIPRAVLPDRSAKGMNPKYNLNREIAASDRAVIEINPGILSTLQIPILAKSPVVAEASNTLF